MKLSDCIADYLNHVRHERGLSPITCKHYASWLHTFTDWLEANSYPDPDLSAFCVPVLRRYQYAKAQTGVRPRTMHSAFHALRGLGEFLVANGVLETNPVKSLTLPRKDAAIRLLVSDEEVRGLLTACERIARPRRAALCRAVVYTLAYGGLRRAELCALKVGDIMLDAKSLIVRNGKGNKSRLLYLPEVWVLALREWLVQRGDCTHDWLFALDRNRRMNEEGLAHLLEEVKAIAGYAGRDNIKPHSLRHWRATDLLRSGADIRDVQAFLGHSQLSTTAVYCNSDELRLRAIADHCQVKPEGSKPLAPVTQRPIERPTRRRFPLR